VCFFFSGTCVYGKRRGHVAGMGLLIRAGAVQGLADRRRADSHRLIFRLAKPTALSRAQQIDTSSSTVVLWWIAVSVRY